MKKITTPTNPDYKNLIDLLAVFSEGQTRLKKLQAEINEEALDLVDPVRSDFAELQESIAAAETAINTLAERNPQWFPDGAKTLKTPYGQVKSTSSTYIDVPSEEATIRLVEAAGLSNAFLRVVKAVDKEALEALTDDELAKYGVIRKKSQSISIKPMEIDLGKAVEAATKRAEAA